MFVRYLGGGIGHLEQFPPANNDDGVTYEYEEEEDNGGTGDAYGDGGSEDEDEEDDKDSDLGNYPDLGESSDEEVGNVY